MSLQSNNDHPRSSALQLGTSEIRHYKQQAPCRGSSNNKIGETNTGKEGIVQKLQEVLFAVRRDRDREHRGCDIALEKLRSAKDILKAENSNFEAEKEKLTKTRDHAEETNKEIQRSEATIQQLQQKYRFQHEDLIRKREKIQQQTIELETIAQRRTKSVLDARRRLDRQRDNYQKIKRQEDQESAKLLSTIIASVRSKENTVVLGNAITIDTIETENRSKKNVSDQHKGSHNTYGLDRIQEAIEKRHEQELIREIKTNMDYAMYPKIISQKANTLKAENETMQAEIARLEAMLHATLDENHL